jgi:CheY-like chemotaxis protein
MRPNMGSCDDRCVRPTALIVDDHDSFRESARSLLEAEGLTVVGIALMIADVGIFGIVAASPAAWFISADEQQDRHQQAEAITTLTAEITALRQRAAELSAYLAAQAARPAKQRHTAAAPTTARRQRPPVPAPAIGGKARVRRQPSGRHAGPLTSTTFTRLPQQPTSRKALNRASSEQATWACAQIRPLGAAPAPTPADQH